MAQPRASFRLSDEQNNTSLVVTGQNSGGPQKLFLNVLRVVLPR